MERQNTYSIESPVNRLLIFQFIIQLQYYSFDKNNSTLIIKEAISSLTISGSNNKIIFQNEILNLIINGSSNKINATHRKCYLSNVVFNGSNNRIEVKPSNQNICNIQNGINNTIYTNSNNRNIRLNNNNSNNMFNFGGSNISINFNGGNSQQISKYNKNIYIIFVYLFFFNFQILMI